MVFLLMQGLDRKKRVRLLNGDLTPVFDSARAAFRYCDMKGIHNCNIVQIKNENKKKKKP